MKENSANSDKLLITELIDGNERAFRTLFDKYRNDIYAYSRSLLKEAEMAEEIVQDTFLKVWLHRDRLNPELSFKSYLFTIARNLAFNKISRLNTERKLKEHILAHSQNTFKPTDDRVQEADYEIIKLKAINQLPPKRKRIFELSRNEGMSYEEISKELNISVSTVKGQMSKALETIRQYLNEHGDIALLITLISFGWLE